MSNIIHTSGNVQLDTPYTTDEELQSCGLTDWRIATDDEVTAWKVANADKIKKQQIKEATMIRNNSYDSITNSVILDQLAITNLDLQLAAGKIIQAQYDTQKTIYQNRISAKATLFATATDNFYTTTGLTRPTITQ